MESIVPGRLAGWEIHGFRTMDDLDFGSIKEEATSRWLRPNEIHAILCNYKYFTINVKPVNMPKSGRIVFFDRKMLRNFRKDGHNWKKKNDGKTVKEAHEHLKVGNEERIHVYYARGEDNPTFVRRCYWLLDKTLEHIVLVHYRETQESQDSPATPVNSNSSSAHSDPSASLVLSEETDSGYDPAYYTAEKAQFGDGNGTSTNPTLLREPDDSIILKDHEIKLHEINTLEWEELLVPDSKFTGPDQGKNEQQNQFGTNGLMSNVAIQSANELLTENSFGSLTEPVSRSNYIQFDTPDNLFLQGIEGQTDSSFQRKDSQLVTVGTGDSLGVLGNDGLQTQDSFGRWMNYIMSDSPGSVDDPHLESSIPIGQEPSMSPMMNHPQSSVPSELFSITDVSPAWAFSTEETKILITGFFNEGHPQLDKSKLYCVCGDAYSPAQIVQSGVFRCFVSPHQEGLVNLYLSFDGHSPISQVLTFEYRTPLKQDPVISVEDKSKAEEFIVQTRLAHLLFFTSKSLKILSSKVSPNAVKEAKIFARKTSQIADGWAQVIESIENNRMTVERAKESFFELTLRNKLYEWLLERVVEGSKTSDYDDHGQGVIHLCAILDYTWAVLPYSFSGLSLDYRDKFGWTALHWAAYYGREKMVAALLSAGAKPNLVSDPTSENPSGSMASDLASKNGYDGLAGYLAEKALVEHFKDMTIAGNVSGSLQTTTPELVNSGNLDEEELYLKDTLSAYRTAADAAARIQAAFREQSFKQRTKAAQVSSPEDEVRTIIAAMKIQHAFRKYETRRKMAAAARIQDRFRTWKIRKDFLNKRRQAMKIQAVFRGFQVRRQYRKIIWSVGVLEKAILRWRKKKRGFRGLQVCPDEAVNDQKQESEVEDFFRVSRNQAEERVERAVVRVQSMFRSKRAQEDYHRMKMAHNEAMLEYKGLVTPEYDMG
ncbi:calmodulin-binding transcription activator 6-like isoform X3 [Rhododendron vialii]|uniref:calmodulin-binding transcription activator 6-like isoform X3 n=1 Tax=Rhododendron vialii TaxID=182163 RepID=UPI00265FB218|nr:calmodulin-binding transcription activator 6-like isoform X3 [Rhododendron vialii]